MLEASLSNCFTGNLPGVSEDQKSKKNNVAFQSQLEHMNNNNHEVKLR